MKIVLCRDELDIIMDAIGNNIEHYEGRGIQVPEMHQLWADLDSYRQVQSVEQIREEQIDQIRRLSIHYLGREPEQEQGMEL